MRFLSTHFHKENSSAVELFTLTRFFTCIFMPLRGRKVTRCMRHDEMALDQLKAKSAQKMREQNDPLLHREGHADANARPGAERNVGETVDPIALFA